MCIIILHRIADTPGFYPARRVALIFPPGFKPFSMIGLQLAQFELHETKLFKKIQTHCVLILQLLIINLPLEEMIGGNKSSRCFSSFSSPCLFGKFRMVWSTSALSITASILAFTMSSASLSLHLDWSSNMCRYSVTVSCFSSIDKTFHVAGHLSSFPRPSNATCHQKCKIKNIYDNYLLLYVYFSDNVLRMISITSQNKMKQYTMELRLTTTELKSCQSFF